MEIIKSRTILSIMILASGLMTGCESGSGTVPQSVNPVENPAGTQSPAPAPAVPPAPAPAPAPAATTGAAIITWAAPVDRVSGALLPMSQIKGYRVYYGKSSTSTSIVIDLPNAQTTQYQLTGLSRGTSYYFRVSVYDMQGIESVKSPVMSKQIL